MRTVPEIPNELVGQFNKGNEYVNSTPRKWTKGEIEWCLKLKEQGYTTKEIAISTGRTEVSVSIKLKRLSKKDDTYNKKHLDEKYKTNDEYIEILKPNSILDVYCGAKKYYNKYLPLIEVTTNDSNKEIESDYTLEALELLCLMYCQKKKFDLIDLDPFGSSAHCLELAIQMAKKGLVVTIGEMGHKRFKRLDFVRRFYGINTLEDFTSDNIIEEIKSIGRKYKKELVVYKKCDWNGISRVWFTIEQIKITEQWEENSCY